MKTYVDLDTQSEVWFLFKEVGAERLLLGKKLRIDVQELIEFFLGQKKLRTLCQIITHSDKEFNDLKEIAKIIRDFFSQTGEELQGLTSILGPRILPQKQKKKQTEENSKKSKSS